MLSACAAGGGTSPAQNAAAAPAVNPCAQESPPPELAGQPNYRRVIVSVVPRDSHPPPKVTAEDLRLYQGNKQLQIASFRPLPIMVMILVDTSGSMEPKLPMCRSALKTFIEDLNQCDQVGLFAFSDRPFLLEPATTDHAEAVQRLSLLHAYGQTALYDVVLDGVMFASKNSLKRKAIFLITDGMDTASSSSLEQAEEAARKADVPIYSIGIGNPHWRSSSSWLTGRAGSTEALDTKTLAALAKGTGGETFVVSLDDKGGALNHAVAAIADKIANQYVMGFVGNGSTNQLRVEAPQYKNITFNVTAPD